MMTRAYRETYLSKAQSALGDAFDYAVNSCGISGVDFVNMFIASSVSKRIESGEPSYLAGKSGIEIVDDVVFETTGKHVETEAQNRFERSKEFWIGWAAAYYQWYSSRKFSEIFNALSFEDFQKMYYTLHEADITKFVEIADERLKTIFPETNLKRIRTLSGCTQSELAARSGVSLRSIQMYEQRRKDINKAGVESVYGLAKALGCTVEDLIEK